MEPIYLMHNTATGVEDLYNSNFIRYPYKYT